ncbi:MAG: hypothetical protein AAF843_18810 [Bacteroidota bacterium]
MKELSYYNLRKDDKVEISSEICSLAETIWHIAPGSTLSNRISELIASYYNQWRFVLDSYEKLFSLVQELNSKDSSSENVLSDFDIFWLKTEPEFKNYSYLLITSLKSLLDLFTCVVDVIQNQQIRREHEFPDFFKYLGQPKKITLWIDELSKYFQDIRVSEKWISKVKIIRDRVIHRGYLLNSHRTKTAQIDDLTIRTYKGSDFYSNREEFNVGELIDNFLINMPKIENSVSNILVQNVDYLKENGVTHASYFRYYELVNEYGSKES